MESDEEKKQAGARDRSGLLCIWVKKELEKLTPWFQQFTLNLVSCRIAVMKKPLSKTNIYLQDPEKRRQDLMRSTLSSSAVEGIILTADEVRKGLESSSTPARSDR